jgi:hypothetical protein
VCLDPAEVERLVAWPPPSWVDRTTVVRAEHPPCQAHAPGLCCRRPSSLPEWPYPGVPQGPPFDRPVDPTGRESADRRIVPRMSTDDSTPSTAPDGSTENITDEQKAYADDLPDGKKAGLVDDDKDSESTDD